MSPSQAVIPISVLPSGKSASASLIGALRFAPGEPRYTHIGDQPLVHVVREAYGDYAGLAAPGYVRLTLALKCLTDSRRTRRRLFERFSTDFEDRWFRSPGLDDPVFYVHRRRGRALYQVCLVSHTSSLTAHAVYRLLEASLRERPEGGWRLLVGDYEEVVPAHPEARLISASMFYERVVHGYRLLTDAEWERFGLVQGRERLAVARTLPELELSDLEVDDDGDA